MVDSNKVGLKRPLLTNKASLEANKNVDHKKGAGTKEVVHGVTVILQSHD